MSESDELEVRGLGAPLAEKGIVVTRPRDQADSFVRELEALGAEVIVVPTIRIVGPADPEPLSEAARQPDQFDWIVFTSVNGVTWFWDAVRSAGLDTRSLAGVSICAIGPATAAAIELEGARPDLVPSDHVAEGVVAAMQEEVDLRGSRILLPQAEAAREVLALALTEAGAEVVKVTAYRSVPDRSGADQLEPRLSRGAIDLITFTSSSTVRNFVDLYGKELGRARVATIGPITSETARAAGLTVDIEAEPHTTSALTQAIVRHYQRAES